MRSCFPIVSDGPEFTPVIASPSYLVAVPVAVAGRRVSFQITVLKVLAGHPEGHASLADLKHFVAVLTSSGADWSQRMKRLAARASELDIFSSGYVLREPSGWQITAKGREFLISIEAAVGRTGAHPCHASSAGHFRPDQPSTQCRATG